MRQFDIKKYKGLQFKFALITSNMTHIAVDWVTSWNIGVLCIYCELCTVKNKKWEMDTYPAISGFLSSHIWMFNFVYVNGYLSSHIWINILKRIRIQS